MASIELRFTKVALDSIKPPALPDGAAGSVYDTYKDKGEAGLQLIVTHAGNKAYYYRAKINGKSERVRLGSYASLSIEQARALTRQKKTMRDKGVNPNKEKRKLREEATFGQLFEIYLNEYAKPKLKSWQHNQRRYENHLADWKHKKLSTITRDEVRKRFKRISADAGTYAANVVLSLISKMFDVAIELKGWEGSNPARGIKKNKEKARDRFIQGDEFARFFQAVMDEPNEMARDYFLLSLFCGQRKSNMLAMRWDQIDFANRTWRIPMTKNGESQTIGLTEPALQILHTRKKEADAVAKANGAKAARPVWVFASNASKSGHYEEPKSAWRRVLDRAQIDDLRIHDIRRTMGSYMAMSGAGQYLIGKALGHKSSAATEIYARVAVDPVREAQEQAAKRMMELMAGNG